MSKRFVFILFISCTFSQSIIDTLSVTIYPEYYYQGIMIEYKFDTNSSNQHKFRLPTEVDSVLYLVSNNDELFEQVLKVENQSVASVEKDGEHKIYLFLNRYNQVPGPRNFSYQFESLSDISTLMMAFHLPFASQEFIASVNDINLEESKIERSKLNIIDLLSKGYSLLLSNKKINCDQYDGAKGVEMILAAHISSKEDRIVTLPLDNKYDDFFVTFT